MKAIVTNDSPNRGTLPSILEHTGIGALLILMAVLSPFAFPAPVQDKGASYRQSVLSIQQEIEANNLDGASALITSVSKEFPSDGGIENLLGVVEIQRGDVSGARGWPQLT
jgi:hypothetical protein